ncbi:MAG: lamin tail domain-containing protein [Saprospiraceae bacterium]|nr:lamin tail domain-containing protein [Saprospiraceae bacterium]
MTNFRSLVKLFATIFLLASLKLHAQVVINEISYNPPESNVDSLEFVEIYNAGNAVVNIGGWLFTGAFEDTLPNVDLQPGDYYVTAIDSLAMMNVLGIQVHQWSSGALNNSGESIKLLDNTESLVDSVLYNDSDPWPTEPDGNGPSLELKDSALDNNDGANWQFSGGATSIVINGFELSCTPGAQNSGGGTGGPAATVAVANFKFTPKDVVVKVGETVRWINNEAVPHNVNGSQVIYPNNPEDFKSGAPMQGTWQFDYIPLTVGLYDYRCDLHFADGMVGTVSVYDPLTYTDFSLARLRLNNDNGSAIYDGVPTTVTGVVHGVNFQPTGYSFYVIDENNVGINVFSFDPGSYVVTEGDRVKVSGVIDQFNGLLEIVPDTIEVISTGNALNVAREVTEITEADESSYLSSQNLEVDSVGSISSSGFNIYTTAFNDSKILIRVDADANIGLSPNEFPEGAWIGVWGIGTQFDNSSPFNSGYQVLALEIGILIDGLPTLKSSEIQLMPNPAYDMINLRSELVISEIGIYSMEGKQLLHKQVSGTETEVDIHSLPAGMHLVKAITDQGIWTSLLSVIR